MNRMLPAQTIRKERAPCIRCYPHKCTPMQARTYPGDKIGARAENRGKLQAEADRVVNAMPPFGAETPHIHRP